MAVWYHYIQSESPKTILHCRCYCWRTFVLAGRDQGRICIFNRKICRLVTPRAENSGIVLIMAVIIVNIVPNCSLILKLWAAPQAPPEWAVCVENNSSNQQLPVIDRMSGFTKAVPLFVHLFAFANGYCDQQRLKKLPCKWFHQNQWNGS